MTQNLDLDITEKMIAQSSLNAFTTDLHSGNVWGVNSATSTTDGNNTCGTDSETLNCQVIDNKAHYAPLATNIVNQTHLLPDAPFGQTWTSTMSWDVGEWVIKNPTTSFSCEAMYSMEECATATDGIIDVSGPEWKGTWSYDKNNSAVNNDTHEYDPHYLTGNYYQWNTATAGSGGMNGDINARDSICPKGWKLPTSGDLSVASNFLNGSIFNQLAGYGLAAEINPGNSVFTSNILSVASNPTVKRRTDLGGNNPNAWPTLGVTDIKTSVKAAEFDARTKPLYYAYTGTIGPWREGGKINLGIGGWF